jgi:hypothetical protein
MVEIGIFCFQAGPERVHYQLLEPYMGEVT